MKKLIAYIFALLALAYTAQAGSQIGGVGISGSGAIVNSGTTTFLGSGTIGISSGTLQVNGSPVSGGNNGITSTTVGGLTVTNGTVLSGTVTNSVTAQYVDGVTIGNSATIITGLAAGITTGNFGGITTANSAPLATQVGFTVSTSGTTPANTLTLQTGTQAVTLGIPQSGTLGSAAFSGTNAFDVAGAAAVAQAFSIQRANHTGTQAQSTITNLVSDLAAKQATLTLTTTGSSGAATLASGTLNVPQYAGTSYTAGLNTSITSGSINSGTAAFGTGAYASAYSLPAASSGTLGGITAITTTGIIHSGTIVSGTIQLNTRTDYPLNSYLKTTGTNSFAWSALQASDLPLTLTTTGSSGAATLSSGTLNVPQYGGGSSLTKASGTTARSATDDATYMTPLQTEAEVSQYASVKPAKLFNTIARFSSAGDISGANYGSLRILAIGDSMLSYGVPARQMWGRYGYGAYFDFGAAGTQPYMTGGAVMVSNQTTIHPTGTTFKLDGAGAAATWPSWTSGGGGGTVPPQGSILAVCYLAQAGGGTFKIQSDSSGVSPGSWSDVAGYTSISTDDGSGGTPTWVFATHPSGPNYYRLRTVQVSGTGASAPIIIMAGVMSANTSASGGNAKGTASYMTWGNGGQTPTAWLASSQANWNAILGGYSPHIAIFSSLENLGDWQTYLSTTISRIKIASPLTDIAICSEPPVEGATANTVSAVNQYLRDYCSQNNILYIDTCRHMPDRTYRTVTDAICTGTTTVTSATAAFSAADVGHLVTTTGTNFTPNATIVSVTSGTQAVLSINAGSGTGVTLRIHDAPSGFYSDDIHLGANGAALSQAIVWRTLQPLLDYDNGGDTGLANPVVNQSGARPGSTQFNFLFPNIEKDGAFIAFASVKSPSASNYTKSGIGLLGNGFTNTGALFFQPGNNPSAFVSAVNAGRRWYFGGTQYSAASLSRLPAGAVEAMPDGSNTPAMVANGVSGQNTDIMQFRTGASESSTGTLASSVDKLGNHVLNVAGLSFQIKAGRTMNTGTLTSGTLAVSDATLAAGEHISCGIDTPAGTPGAPYISSRTNGTGFTITSTSGSDTSTVWYRIDKQN